MPSLPDLANTLTESLNLTAPPVAVAFAESVPAGVPVWDGNAPAGCRFWQEGMKQVFATTARDHDLCAIGLYTHHLGIDSAAEANLHDALKVFDDLGYVRPSDMPFIPALNREAKVVVYGPLAGFPVAPDAVLLFVRADQMLILSEASQQMENALPPAMGRPACGAIPQAINTGRTALSLGCCGARAYLDALSPELAMYAIPGTALEAFTERVKALANANSILTAFHTKRRSDVEAGARPSVKESLARMA